MPSLFDYFNNDFTLGVSLDNRKVITYQKFNKDKRVIGQGSVEIIERLHLHSQTSIRLPTYYVPLNDNTFDILIEIIKQIGKPNPKILNLDMTVGFSGDDRAGLEKTTYASRIYFYTETTLNEEEIQQLTKFCKPKELFLTLRSTKYLNTKMELEKAKAFISHDSKDKELIAKRIAKGLASRLCPVWYDEYSLKIGDSLRESIEKGIKEACKCIVIITPNFLNNLGWSKTEFSSIFTRELVNNERVILPIWYGVTAKEVYEYSPSLADTFALTWPSQSDKSDKEYNEQVEEIISKIHTKVTS